MNDGNARQQIVEKIKNSTNILITVSTDPSVDELSAALGLTILLNKMNKHTTAVFSGAIPQAMKFLDPEKTFEGTVDSLRDFIIALDKEKADHLRYKVDGDVVKIFITPYRTTITSDDLEFSQGDYNVELVLALGVDRRENLDAALSAHGRILHDAMVATVSVGDMRSELGSVNLREQNASSLSEVLMSMTESFKNDKGVLDEQIATAFLTGIVAATDRFSNNKTSSKVMTMAAQLMAAGANQQLIASKLEEANEIGQKQAEKAQTQQREHDNSDGTTDLSEGQSTKVSRNRRRSRRGSGGGSAAPQQQEAPKPNDGSLHISHMPVGDVDEIAAVTEAANQAEALDTAEDHLERHGQDTIAAQQQSAADVAEQSLADELELITPPAVPAAVTISVADLQQDVAEAQADVVEAAEQPMVTVPDEAPAPVSLKDVPAPEPEPRVEPAAEAPVVHQQPPAPTVPEAPILSGAVSPEAWQHTPSIGGTLNATTEQAADEKRREEANSRNRTILSHGGSSKHLGKGDQVFDSPMNAASLPSDEPSIPDPFANLTPPADPNPPTLYAPTIEPLSTLADLDEQHRTSAPDEARAAIDAAFGTVGIPEPYAQPVSPFAAEQLFDSPQASADLPPLPPLPDFSTLPPPLPAPEQFDAAYGAQQPDILGDVFAPIPAPEQQPAPQPSAPGQFRIPGQ